MGNYSGGSSNDSITGSSENDQIVANGGNDTVKGGDGQDTLYGGSGNDSVYGGNGYDRIFGDGGDDKLYGGNDVYEDFYGGSGNDTIYGGDAEEDWAWGGDDQDLIYMGGGADMGYGGAGQDTVYGGAGNDAVTGASGNDSVYGDAGQDRVYGGSGRDTLDGGADNDTMGGGSGSDQVQGGAGNDVIYGDRDAYDALLDASVGPVDTTLTIVNSGPFALDVYWIDTAGQPQLKGTIQPGGTYSAQTGTGHNWFLTQSGNTAPLEIIYGAPNQTVTFGPDFNDTLSGGDGDDTIYSDFGSDLIYGDAGHDRIVTGDGNDTAYGGFGNDSISMGTGNDSFGSWGGEDGNDTIDGEAGNDTIIAGAGNDVVYGGDGNDSLSGATGADTLYGGAGADAFAISDDHQQDAIYGGESGTDVDTINFANYTSTSGVVVTYTGSEAGSYDFAGTDGAGSFAGIEAINATNYADTLDASLSNSATTLNAGAGDDLVKGGAGADTIAFGSGNDTVYGGAGNDLIDDIANAQYSGANLIDAGAGDDTVWTGDGDDTLDGGDGADLLAGEGGNDLLRGGSGHDVLAGDIGNDTMTGGTGNDTLFGGEGSDIATFSGPVTDYSFDYGSGGALIVTDSVAGRDGTDTLNAVEYVTFGGKTYRLVTGDDGTNTTLQGPDGEPALIIAHDGNDWGGGHATSDAIFGGAGDDTLDGGDGNDTLVGEGDNDLLRGDAGDDLAYGGTGNDTLQGGAGNDTLDGGAGNDVLQGGTGNDLLSGGSGNDLFQLVTAGGGDLITDFSMALSPEGMTDDQLDVSDLRNPDGSAVRGWDVQVSDDGNGNAVLTFPQGESVVLHGVSPASVTSQGMLAAMGVPCFAQGTRIDTPQGPRDVESLAVGDAVCTKLGQAVVLWHGRRALTAAALADSPQHRPVRIAAGAVGNARVLTLSPQHGVQVPGVAGLVRARHLAELGQGARIAKGMASVCYHHLLLPQHALIRAEGAWVESFYPGPMAVAGLDPADRLALTRVILALSPGGLGSLANRYGPRILPLLSRQAADLAMSVRGKAQGLRRAEGIT